MTAYRIVVGAEVNVNTAGPATRDELVKIGEGIALGVPPSGALLASPITETITVEIRDPECQDTTHRRNAIDGRTYQCGADEADPIHESVDECSEQRGEPCRRPDEHHAYVSPGFEAPAS